MKPRFTRATSRGQVWGMSAIVDALGRARWGVLGGKEWRGLSVVLVALAALARKQRVDRGGTITTTAWQLAGAANYSEKWVRKCLQRLQFAGIIRVDRGNYGNRRRGHPDPSLITINRRRLMAILNHARGTAAEAERKHAAETYARLRKIRSGFAKSKTPRLLGGDQPELATSLRPHGEASTGRTPPEQPTLTALMARAGYAEARTTAPPAPSPDDTGPPTLTDPSYAWGPDLMRQLAGIPRKAAAHA